MKNEQIYNELHNCHQWQIETVAISFNRKVLRKNDKTRKESCIHINWSVN